MTLRVRPLRLVLPSLLLACSPAPPEQPAEWHEEDGHRWRELAVSRWGRGGFTRLDPSSTGMESVNELDPEVSRQHDHLLVGSGVALGDVDGDGRVDVYLSRLEGPNRLYRNLGDWRFEEVAEAAGAAAPGRYSTGASMADVDGDGDLDLMVTALGGPNALFLNDGTGRFTDVTDEAGVSSRLGGTTSAFADVDGDGDLDLYVANYKVESAADLLRPFEEESVRVVLEEGDSLVIAPGFEGHFRLETRMGREIAVEQADPDRLYLNDGTGVFEAVSWTSGRFREASGEPLERDLDDFALAARFTDVDGDGDPDLYVCHDFDDPDRLWINQGGGIFRASDPLALRSTSHASMSVDFSDVDRDGRVDVFTADMLSPERERRLRQQPLHGMIEKPMGMADERLQFQHNSLFLSRGDGTFSQIAELAGVDASGWTWGSLFLDVDLDGYEDLLMATGHGRDTQDGDALDRISALRGRMTWIEAKRLYPELRLPNRAFRNRGDLTFEEIGPQWGLGTEEDISHGLATGDLDGDGDLDVVVNRLRDTPAVLRNDETAGRVAVRLVGRAPNTRGVGARVRLRGGPVPVQQKEMTAGGLYLSSAEPLVVFAAGESGDAGPLALEVEWPGGGRSVVEGVAPNRLYEVRETGAEDAPGGRAEAEVGSGGPRDRVATDGVAPDGDRATVDRGAAGDRHATAGGAGAPYFTDVSDLLSHTHVDTPFDEFGWRQPLLPYRLARLGPGVGWIDVDDDGDPDLVVPPGRGGSLSVLRNDGGRFTEVVVETGEGSLDRTAVVGLPDGEGGRSAVVGQATYEAATPTAARATPAAVRMVPGGRRGARGSAEAGEVDEAGEVGEVAREARIEPVAPPMTGSAGPLALADVDGDGDLDLFVGGRVIPTLYPRPATSRLLLNHERGFVDDPANEALFREIGLVSGAVFSDVDADGDPDLVLALEWGSPRLLLNHEGRLSDATTRWGLDDLSGRWNGVTAGDFDGDGRMDLVLTGQGRNVRERPRPDSPLLLFHGDVDRNGVWDLFPARRDEDGELRPLERYERLRSALPSLRGRIPDFASYGRATLAEVTGTPPDEMLRVEARTFEHLLLLNRGGSFDLRPLPLEAQFAPAFGAAVADFDGDGREDLFLAQNFFPTDPWTPRYDSGRGLWLRGTPDGLDPVPGQVSGVTVYGDQRGAAVADYDGDGRVDLVVTQNAGPTRLFRNVGGRPGLRVRIDGPPGNPDGVGAMLRVVYGERRGPAREIHGGSGYWSSDGPVQVLGLEEAPTAVRIRWPGGREQTVPVPAGSREVTVRGEGSGGREGTEGTEGTP